MHSVVRLIIIPILVILTAASCRRKEDNPQVQQTAGGPWCTLNSVVHESKGCKDSTYIEYDSARRISSTIRYNYCASGIPGKPLISRTWFVYDAGKVFILDTSFMADKDTLVVDAALRIVENHLGSPGNAKLSLWGRYEYTPEGLLKASIIQHAGGPDDTTSYGYTNGDLREAVNKTGTLRYFYYEDKPVAAASYVTQNGLGYGSAFFHKNAHLLKEIQDGQGNTITSFTYGFGDFGNVTSKMANSGGSTGIDTTRYNYMCAVD